MFTKKHINSKRRAVSPIVATLILVVVAVVGGGVVAVMTGQIGSDTSKQASSANTADKSTSQLVIGGSTTVFPLTEAIRPAFEATNGIKIVDQQGGSGAGMIGVHQGALDIGATSSLKTYQDEVAKDALADLRSFEIAGSAVIPIAKGLDPACTSITQQALALLYASGAAATFTSPTAGACADGGFINATDITAGTALGTVQRSDPSGTEETWAKFVTGGTSVDTAGAVGADGNSGVLAKVQTGTLAAPFIGFVDEGFAKDIATGKAIVQILAVQNGNTGTSNPSAAVAIGASTGPLETQIKIGLKSTTAVPSFFPPSQTTGNQLVRTMYYVTHGAPSTIEQKFIDYARSTDSNAAGQGVVDKIHSVGYFSYVDYK